MRVGEEGVGLGYGNVEERKGMMREVWYVESRDEGKVERKVMVKVGRGRKGKVWGIGGEEVVGMNGYMGKLKFGGRGVEVMWRKGDVVIGGVRVLDEGGVGEWEVYEGMEEEVKGYMMEMELDGGVYVWGVRDGVGGGEDVRDVDIEENGVGEEGMLIGREDREGDMGGGEGVAGMRDRGWG